VVSEAERMKDIVRKIGKITKYETKSYVGSQRILDLDKAVGEAREGEAGRLASSWPPSGAAARPGQAPPEVVVPRPPALPIEEAPRRSQLPPGGFPRPSQSPPSGLRRPSPLGIEGGGSGFPLEGAPRPSQLPPGGFPRPSTMPAARDSAPPKPSAVFRKPGTPERGEGGSGTGTGGQP
jgi:hypothetical protein